MKVREIYEMINDHTHWVSVCVCIHNWGNEPDGVVIDPNMSEDTLLTLLGEKVPDAWFIESESEDTILLSFLFK